MSYLRLFKVNTLIEFLFKLSEATQVDTSIIQVLATDNDAGADGTVTYRISGMIIDKRI